MQDSIIAYARECLGTPYQHQARVKGLGMDCVGLLVYVAQKLCLPYLDGQGYKATPSEGILQAMLDSQESLERIYTRERGCIFLMTFINNPQHVAIWTGETIIHAYQGSGMVVEHRLNEQWERRIVAMYRFKA